MIRTGNIKSKEDLANIIKAIGQDLIDRADDIATDWNKKILGIKITSTVNPDEVIYNTVTKEYLVGA